MIEKRHLLTFSIEMHTFRENHFNSISAKTEKNEIEKWPLRTSFQCSPQQKWKLYKKKNHVIQHRKCSSFLKSLLNPSCKGSPIVSSESFKSVNQSKKLIDIITQYIFFIITTCSVRCCYSFDIVGFFNRSY